MSNLQIIELLEEHDAMLNVYPSNGMYITRLVSKSKPNSKAIQVASSTSLEKSVHKAISGLTKETKGSVV